MPEVLLIVTQNRELVETAGAPPPPAPPHMYTSTVTGLPTEVAPRV